MFYRVLIFLLTASAFGTEQYTFQVILEGKAPIGGYEEMIKALEDSGEFISTLCGLYIQMGKLPSASKTCDLAVEREQSHIAYNNRGVLRAKLKNVSGALDDFARARIPPEMKLSYLDNLIRGDVRLTADLNYTEMERYRDRKTSDMGEKLSKRLQTAEIEEIN